MKSQALLQVSHLHYFIRYSQQASKVAIIIIFFPEEETGA